MWIIITIILGVLAMFLIGVSLLTEIAKIRRALEHMAYKKEIHEIIETDYEPEGTEAGDEPATDDSDEVKAEKPEKPKPAPIRRYRKTRIKVVEERE
ncbi:hypothetical protein A2303_02665 [Candidatus Falkowbacteria bacterium RIFOXYB2_FULL_47_14]|uniref:Uncharacterized protein n=1 Tax=Candidatus Falkowbacteria bacterium RIFOXYA2_FULL_47_19 TaxID=1797994 RepID=A0A1F5SH39_9BACT|nr:MAG: hypothetical protein A2227_05770 [Candidatus Falkowbacteria bacterium RIFOXYA2_FULL_47_19]OGF34520.1 MAG: hypothetical protein A2468_04810 [Candidatus Falkowbacteria bacterium RIFOXYC2_FULL_46_15]OGF43025.1 MAG: hypothetical protein A2303_02665 [Candidatus Falkowbacteria bacterium RIFOXYB2_FULL_47_14]